ncbi:MAG: bacillithiol biosynthesis deacetylase BshB1 [Fluviicola sp.]
MKQQIDILAFGAHPDDVELSAAGILLAHKAKGYSIGIIDLTEGELGTRGTVETRYSEAKKSAEILGLSARVNLNLGDGRFQNTPEEQAKIIEQIRRFRPKIVLCNAPSDRHPDHGRGSKLVADACFFSGLRKIETEWEGEKQEVYRPEFVYHYIQDYFIEPDLVIDVTEFVDTKIECIKAFNTQFYSPDSKEPVTPISGEHFFEFIRSRMSGLGRFIGAQYAEGLICARTPGVKDLFDLK